MTQRSFEKEQEYNQKKYTGQKYNKRRE